VWPVLSIRILVLMPASRDAEFSKFCLKFLYSKVETGRPHALVF
jgi:hypothetical protein